MVSRVLLVTLSLLALSAGPASAALQSHGLRHSTSTAASTAAAAAGSVPGELLVRFERGARPAARIAARREAGATPGRRLSLPGLQLVNLHRGSSLRAAIAALERSPEVVYAQPNHRYRLAALPNDTRLPDLWGLNNTGQPVAGSPGKPDADVDATEAWDLTKGSPGITVAIADSGIAYDHPDLKPNLWTNPGETGSGREGNGRDDDRNGLIDDWRGWDFADNDSDPRDPEGHGTHVAGTVGARGNNNFGTVGINWDVRLMALRVADAVGLVTDAAIIDAFDYAAKKGARVLNASFVSPQPSDALRDAIRRHPKALFAAAAGNGDADGVGDDNDRAPQYPCSYDLVNLLCVAASDQSDNLASFSNFGDSTVDIAAPGQNVLSAAPAYGSPVFADGFEAPLDGIWVTGGTNNSWDRIATVAHGGAYSLSDSPGTTYLDNTDSFVRTANPVSLAGQGGCRLDYALRLATEPGVDKLLLELSPDGSSWTTISDSSGSSLGSFVSLSDDVSRFDGAPAVFVRFRLVTNASVTSDGAQIDDVALRCLGSTYAGTEFVFSDGTSMATPHVSGTAALVWAKYRSLGVQAVRDAILRGADDSPALAGKVGSGGRLNARRALGEARKLLPKLVLSGPRRQRLRRDGKVVVVTRCKSGCTVIASGTVSVGGASKTLRLKRVVRAVRGKKKLKLALTRSARARVQRALARGKRVRATISASATDRRGSVAKSKRTITLRR